jgi:hypothetical protein
MITKRKMIAVCAAVVIGWGLFSCTLEPSADSPSNKTVTLLEGIPDGMAVSEPRITYDGTTTTLTYIVSVSPWPWPDPDNGPSYTAQNSASSAGDDELPLPDPLSVEALILRYGALFSSADVPLTKVEKDTSYPLKSATSAGGKALPYVIIPLDTSLIRDYLKEKLEIGVTEDTEEEEVEVPLVWIEENPAIGLIETVDTEGGANWKDGVYEDEGIRIGGFYKAEVVPEETEGGGEDAEDEETVYEYPVSTIENFDDGKEGRIRSIATVLADGTDRNKQRYTSTINFYADTKAKEIEASAPPASSPTSVAAGSAKVLGTWMGANANKPVLRVVYQWAN